MVENDITKCFGLFKKSASRKLKLTAIAKVRRKIVMNHGVVCRKVTFEQQPSEREKSQERTEKKILSVY